MTVGEAIQNGASCVQCLIKSGNIPLLPAVCHLAHDSLRYSAGVISTAIICGEGCCSDGRPAMRVMPPGDIRLSASLSSPLLLARFSSSRLRSDVRTIDGMAAE